MGNQNFDEIGPNDGLDFTWRSVDQLREETGDARWGQDTLALLYGSIGGGSSAHQTCMPDATLLVRHKIGKHTQFYLLHTQLYKSDLETDLKAFENDAGVCSTPSPDSILKIFRNAILLRKGYLLATTQIMIRKRGGEPSPSVCCRIVLVEISRIRHNRTNLMKWWMTFL